MPPRKPDTMDISVIRYYANEIENKLLSIVWKNPGVLDDLNGILCPIVQDLSAIAAADPANMTGQIQGWSASWTSPGGGGLGMCPPGTRDCGDGICRPCCGGGGPIPTGETPRS